MFDRTDAGLRVFIGYNDLLLTTQNVGMDGGWLSLPGAAERVSRLFGGAEVAVMGQTPQSPYLPHIDESFVLLDGRTAVVTRLPGSTSDEARELGGYAGQLADLGYRVLTIDSTIESVRRYEASTNAVPFIERTTGRRRIIYPVFPAEVDPQAIGALSKAALRGKGLHAWEVYASAGYEPLPVRDFAHVVGGASHCISNALN